MTAATRRKEATTTAATVAAAAPRRRRKAPRAVSHTLTRAPVAGVRWASRAWRCETRSERPAGGGSEREREGGTAGARDRQRDMVGEREVVVRDCGGDDAKQEKSAQKKTAAAAAEEEQEHQRERTRTCGLKTKRNKSLKSTRIGNTRRRGAVPSCCIAARCSLHLLGLVRLLLSLLGDIASIVTPWRWRSRSLTGECW